LVLSGAVYLMVSSMNAKTKGFDRKKATELAQIVIERQVNKKDNDATSFWSQTTVLNQEEAGFDNYKYNLEFVPDSTSPNCTADKCMKVKVTVTMPGRSDTVLFERFFAKI